MRIEQIGITLMLDRGYECVSVDAIAAAAGVGRTSIFRLFGSKKGIVWSSFDEMNAWLAEDLRTASITVPLEALRHAIVRSTARTLEATEVWQMRFKLIDTSSALRAEASAYWEQWRGVLTAHLSEATGWPDMDARLQAIAGAAQGVFIAELRNWATRDSEGTAFLVQLDSSLTTVFRPLRSLVADLRT